MSRELEQFVAVWDQEAKKTVQLLKALPEGQYDFRPDPNGRSLGEMAWHLAEVDGYMTYCIETGQFTFDSKVPNLARPRAIAELAPGYQRIHDEAMARVRRLAPEDLSRRLKYFDGQSMTISWILWEGLLHHLIHHRGQLALLCRLSGGKPPGMFGPNREEMVAMMEAMKKQS